MSNIKSARLEHLASQRFSYYFVAYLDFVGQKRLLCEMDKYELADPMPSELSPLIGKTFIAVAKFRDAFENFVEEKQTTFDISTLPEPVQNEFVRLRSTKVTTQVFSDSFIYHVKLSTPHPLPVLSIYTALMGCAALIASSLATKLPIRGGIDMGWGGELGRGEVYGPALVKAYHLESNIADYPRIVIGQSLIDYLKAHMRSEDRENRVEGITAHHAEKCLGLITCDCDKQHILNYLGQTYYDTCSHINSFELVTNRVLIPAYKFIAAEHERFEQAGDKKLAPRYEKLKRYFDVSLPIWGIDPSLLT